MAENRGRDEVAHGSAEHEGQEGASPSRARPGTRPPPKAVILVGLGFLVAFLYPFAAEPVLGRLGVRGAAAVLLLLGGASLAVRRSAASAFVPPPWLRAGLLALPVLALVTGDVRYVLLVPAAIHAAVAGLFGLSLRGGGSLLETAAHYLQPNAPEFIRPYCRKVTALFAGILVLQSTGLVVLALGEAGQVDSSWAWRSGVVAWAPLGIALVVEWIVRKSWFRYYGGGPVDRVLRILLPPENTATGRRSLDYIRRKRRELGMPPPP